MNKLQLMVVGWGPLLFSSRDLNGNSTLTPNQDSEIIKKIFIDFSTGLYTAEKLRKKYYNNLKFTKQSFLNMLRNPVYIGKIKVKDKKKKNNLLMGYINL